MNINHQEVDHFNQISQEWWERNGTFKTLHDINPHRLAFINQRVNLTHLQVIDVGCGGGILAESLARQGAVVTGIDAAEQAILAAQEHAAQSPQLDLNYLHTTAEDMLESHTSQYNVLICMELLEHVPNPAQLIKTCAELVKPGGHLFFSTLNRTAKAYLLAIIGAEYLLKWLPKGLHHYDQFIRPSEFAAWARAAQLTVKCLVGLSYSPITSQYRLSEDVSVNYLVYCQKINHCSAT